MAFEPVREQKEGSLRAAAGRGGRSYLCSGKHSLIRTFSVMLPKVSRLKSRYDFRRVKKIGKTLHSPYFTLLYAPAKGKVTSRFGFVASTKFDKRAVVRNRARRLMREAIRRRLDDIRSGFDIVLIAKGPIKDAKLHEVSASLDQLLSKVHLL